MEIWEDIPGYEGKYQVSNLGNVKSLKDNHGNYREKILKPGKHRNNYLIVVLCKDGKGENYYVHRLVAEVFVPKIEGKTHVDHIDGNRSNNVYTNLRYCTPKENHNFELARKHQSEAQKGKHIGEKNSMYGKHHNKETKCKIGEANSKKVLCIELNKIFGNAYEAEREMGISHQNISKCCLGKLKSSGKHPVTGERLHWRYL